MQYKNSKTLICIFSLIFILLLSVSCSNPNTVILEDNTLNLKKVAIEYRNSISFTEELEKDRLKQKIPSVEGMEKGIKVTPFNILVSKNEENYLKIYPEIPGFTYLDTSMLPDDALEVLDNFCSAIIEEAESETYVNPNAMYTLVLFLYDLEQTKAKFSSYVAGQPFSEDGTYFECPVRFYYVTENEISNELSSIYDPFLDVDILLCCENNNWTINQIVYDIEN